jgi:hypothetical protein
LPDQAQQAAGQVPRVHESLPVPKDVEPAPASLPIPELDPAHVPSDPAAALKALDKLKEWVGTHKP